MKKIPKIKINNLILNIKKARKVAREPKTLPTVDGICPCCSYRIEREPIGICDSEINLDFLGAGYPLFYNWMRYCIYILAIFFLSSGVFNLFSNFYGFKK